MQPRQPQTSKLLFHCEQHPNKCFKVLSRIFQRDTPSLNGYVVEHSCSKGQIIVRHFNFKGLCQSQNSFVTDEDPRG